MAADMESEEQLYKELWQFVALTSQNILGAVPPENEQSETCVHQFLQPNQESMFIILNDNSEPVLSQNLIELSAESCNFILALFKRKHNLLAKEIKENIITITIPIKPQNANFTENIDTFKSLVSFNINLYFDILHDNGSLGDLPENTVSNIKKAFAGAFNSLHQVYQSIQIPNLMASIPEHILTLIETDTLDSNASMLNTVESIVRSWVSQTDSMIQLSHNIADASVPDEISFWMTKTETLNAIYQQLQSPVITTIIAYLQLHKRSQRAISLLSLNLIKDSISQATKNAQFLKDLPYKEIYNAKDLVSLQNGIEELFLYLKKLRTFAYPVARAIDLVQLLVNDINVKLLDLLSVEAYLNQPYEIFEIIEQQCLSLLTKLDDHLRSFINIAREQQRKRGTGFAPFKINALTSLKNHIQSLSDIKKSFENISNCATRFLSSKHAATLPSETQQRILNDLQNCQFALRSKDVKHILSSDDLAFSQFNKTYTEASYSLEKSFIQALKTILEKAINHELDAFIILKEFYYLLLYPNIRVSLVPFHAKLLSSIDLSLETIENQLKNIEFLTSIIHERGVPPKSAKMVFVRQTMNSLSEVSSRLELILSSDWQQYPEGKRFSIKITQIITELNVSEFMDNWIEKINNKLKSSIDKKSILLCHQNVDRWEIKVNLDEIDEDLIDEYYCLDLLKFDFSEKVNKQLILKLEQIAHHATSLNDTITSLNYCITSSTTLGNMEMLLLPTLTEILSLVEILSSKTWKEVSIANQFLDSGYSDTKRIAVVTYIESLSTLLLSCVDQVQKLKLIRKQLFIALRNLVSCDFDLNMIQSQLFKLQEIVNTMLIGLYAGVDDFVITLNKNIKEILLVKYKLILADFRNQWDSSTSKITSFPFKEHYVLVKGFSITISPPPENSKAYFIKLLNSFFEALCCQKMISYTLQPSNQLYFTLSEIESSEEYIFALKVLLNKFDKIGLYRDKWLSLESIWDFSIDELCVKLDEKLPEWLTFAGKLKQIKNILESIETNNKFGLVTFNYSQAQNRIYSQYETWQHSVLEKFSLVVRGNTNTLVYKLKNLKENLAANYIQLPLSSSIIVSLSILRDSSKSMNKMIQDIKIVKSCHFCLLQNRFKHLKNWIYFDQIQSEIDSINGLMQVNGKNITDNYSSILSILENEKVKITKSIKVYRDKWEDKSISEDTSVSEAIIIIESFEKSLNEISDKVNHLKNSYRFLEIQINDDELFIKDILTELSNLKNIWETIFSIGGVINEINLLEWKSIVVSKLKNKLEQVLLDLQKASTLVKEYPAFQKIQSYVKESLRALPLIGLLKDEAIEEHHLKEVFNTLNEKSFRSPLTVGDIFALKLLVHEKYLKNVIQKAQSEKLIEVSITTITDRWEETSFSLIEFGNQETIITSWDTLFQYLTDDLNTIASIKSSPYFYRFSKKTDLVQKKLDRLFSVLNIWIDCQKQWVHLYGTFNENIAIKNIMPIEVNRFENASLELRHLTKSFSQSGVVIDILNIPNIEQVLTKILKTLFKVKTALIAYLEKQRDTFPRFYFVGNDDLLELVGNPNNLEIISKHIKNMFIGIESLSFHQDSLLIKGAVSPESEILLFDNPVSLIKNKGLSNILNSIENEITVTLSNVFTMAYSEFKSFYQKANMEETLLPFVQKNLDQVNCLTLQVFLTSEIDLSIQANSFNNVKDFITNGLRILNESLFTAFENIDRLKIENFIIELIHYETLINKLISTPETQGNNYAWFSQQKFYMTKKKEESNVIVKQGNSTLNYGFEYLGVKRKLAYTPLIESAFVSMTESINQHLGSLLIGPAGTGKTESIKALGRNLGKMVFVFCCDDSFDYEAVSRILIGISCVGAWGCFDEFNRLEKNILSAMSTQIEKIESSLASNEATTIELLNRSVLISKETAIFITNNPNYEGRSTLPDNLKNKYITFTMSKPDSKIIAEVLFSTQGYKNSNFLGEKIVEFYSILLAQCSKQIHYDFGLRSVKSVLITCGKLKRETLKHNSSEIDEQMLVIQSLYNVVLPKLIKIDKKLFDLALKRVFVGFTGLLPDMYLEQTIREIAHVSGFTVSDEWVQKSIQVFEIQKLNHGLILVGESGSGKTSVFNCVLKAMSSFTKKENLCFTINAKVLSKESLFGTLDYATREWTDGIFTSIIRRANESTRGESRKNIWIKFDCEVDPEWVENLNSVLDDNKLLTLPNGERLDVPDNVKIIFEVDSLKHATPATISRCGIIWFENHIISCFDYLKKQLFDLSNNRIQDEELYDKILLPHNITVTDYKHALTTTINKILSEAIVFQVLALAHKYQNVLSSADNYKWSTFCVLMKDALTVLLKHVAENTYLSHCDYTKYFEKKVLLSVFWSFAGAFNYADRAKFEQDLRSIPQLFEGLSVLKQPLLHSEVSVETSQWVNITCDVPSIIADPHMVTNPDVVIPTVDTATYESHMFKILKRRKPLILCGPPGAGKTMLLLSSLRKSREFSLISLNFSKETVPELVINSLEHETTYQMTLSGLTMKPSVPGKWVVVFCDELNLPKRDKYESQIVISFLRGLIINKGFWHPKKREWVNLRNIQVVGACNPPDDFTRHALNKRFQNVFDVLMIDYPSKQSLNQVYTVFNSAILKCAPELLGFVDSITKAMLNVYEAYRNQFHETDKPHYISSPRELTRWVRGLFHGLKALTVSTLEGLVRLWAHEGLRLFFDKLATESDRNSVLSIIRNVATEQFPHINHEKTLEMPILYSDWLTYDYESVDKESLRKFLKQKFEIFNEEESRAQIILYDDLLDHALRVDRVLKNTQGHLMLVGNSGSGKSTIVKFVAWMNGIKTCQLSVSRNYTLADFDETLRSLLLRCGVSNEKLCLLINESTILETSFLERMNTLLANAEVPGLFEGEDYDSLMSACSKSSKEAGLMLESNEELYAWFKSQIAQNFHVVFTLSNPYSFDSSISTQSNALMNRCVINWMGEWNERIQRQIAVKMLERLPFEAYNGKMHKDNTHQIVTEIFINIQNISLELNIDLNLHSISFLNLLNAFVKMFTDKVTNIQKKQNHTMNGLDKMRETVVKVKKLTCKLNEKTIELRDKEQDARLVLDKMIMDQNESERKQDMSMEMKKLFAKQEEKIRIKRDSVRRELREVEPLVYEAQQGVKNIKKQHLTELRAMRNPPETIKMVLESVCILLGYQVDTWSDVQQVIRQDDFITSIVNYDGEAQLTAPTIKFMDAHYLNRPNYNHDSANRASKALGPLLMWVKAQLRFATINAEVEPLREELKRLELELIDSKSKLAAIEGMITDLKGEIEEYKVKYSEVIRQTESIKIEMKDVELKVSRSTKLLESLKAERIRWTLNVDKYNEKREFIVGDCILGAVFTTCCGSLLETKRNELLTHLATHLANSGIRFDTKFKALELASPEQILEWQKLNLPNDNQFMENVCIMKSNYNELYSLLIDPTCQMMDFLKKSERSLVVTSFLDTEFINLLETCVKFGGSILIQNGEYYDPCIDRLIAKDIRLIGNGREIIQLGSKEIDFNSNFRLFIHTKDENIKVMPFLKNRMKLLNFTLTNETLRNEALNLVLKNENPEIESKRYTLIRMKDEYTGRLRVYENDLLDTINASKENILENEDLLQNLELLKKKSIDISIKSDELDEVIDNLNSIITKFRPLGELYVDITNMVRSLWKINQMYWFATETSQKILQAVLTEKKGYDLAQLLHAFIERAYYELSTSLLEVDRSTVKKVFDKISAKHNVIPNEIQFENCSVANSVADGQFLLVRSPDGFDPSVFIEQLGRSINVKVEKYSMGQIGGFQIAKSKINNGAENDKWVIIENIELSLELLESMPKLIFDLNSQNKSTKFKLFLTTKFGGEIPVAVIESCKQIAFEVQRGVKQIMSSHLMNPNYSYNILTEVNPKELGMLFLTTTWFYTLIVEKLKYTPLVFTQEYELNETDLLVAMKFIKDLMSTFNKKYVEGIIPFDIIVEMVGSILFGGKVDNVNDKKIITDLAKRLFVSEMFDGYNLLAGTGSELYAPVNYYDGEVIKSWVSELPETEPLSWLGLNEDIRYDLIQESDRISNANLVKIWN